MTDQKPTTISNKSLAKVFIDLFQDAVQMAESSDPNIRVMAASVFKYLYVQSSIISNWKFIGESEKKQMEEIMVDLRRRIEEL